jgi:tagatose 6-phosphate kinase
VILDAVGPSLLQALPKRPFLIKPNQSEVARTLGIEIGSEAVLRDAMHELVSRGSTWVVVTRAREGTLVTDGQDFFRLDSPPVNVVSAIGSGDAFAAGLASEIVRGKAVPQACVLATACGAANAMTPFAGHVRREDVDVLVPKVQINLL